MLRCYYMATIVRALWLAAKQARFSCNDRASLAAGGVVHGMY